MTPREQAHRDILTHYRRWRAIEPVPINAMNRIVQGYAGILADDNIQGDESDPAWIMRYQIAKEYLDTISTYPVYWRTSHPVGQRPVPYTLQLIGKRITGLGWPG